MANKKNYSQKAKRQAKKTAKKVVKKHKGKVLIAFAIIIAILIIAVIVTYCVKPQIFKDLINLIQNGNGDNSSDGEKGEGGTVVSGEVGEISSSELSIHFLMLGNKYSGDSVLIKVGDTEILIDAGSREGSASTLVEYVNTYCTDGVLEYVIATHSDQDHIAAFYPSTGIFANFECRTIIDFARTDKELLTDKGNNTVYGKYVEARDKETNEGAVHYTARQCYDETDGASRRYYLNEENTISLNILYNYYYYNSSNDENNYSVVTMITEERAEGDRHYLLTGDLEEDGESRMVDYYAVSSNSKSEHDILPEVDLYKAGHHGSKTSSTAKLLAVIKPKFVAVSCCCGSPEFTLNNDNTFPTQIAISNISLYTDKIYVTSLATEVPPVVDGKITEKEWEYTAMNGNIVFYSTGTELKLFCSNNSTILKDTEWFTNNRVW